MTEKKQGYQPETVIATNPPNCRSGVTPPNNNRLLIDIPADGNYIEILGHRIDGFESFEAFCEHLKNYAVLEETVKNQRAEIERLKSPCEMQIEVSQKIEKTIKAEAVKEFAERLKEHKIDVDVSFGYGKEVYTEAVAVVEIDNLVKEMVGAESG